MRKRFVPGCRGRLSVFFDITLTWLWKKIYSGIEVRHEGRLAALAETHELVYMPSHRSHVDYLLIGYVLYYAGLLPPHTIAGINLNFWPVGPLLRRGGGVFIRRSFSGNRLYGKVVSEFVAFLVSSGFPLCFYPEGGRSRTGQLLPPKMGILSMVVEAGRNPGRRPLLLVPVWIGYDRLMEARGYVTELRGRGKQTESLRSLLKAGRMIASRFGKAYVSFGSPLSLEEYLEQPSRVKGGQSPAGEAVPAFSVQRLAWEMSVRTNQAAVVSPASLFSLILLATPRNALSEVDLLKVAGIFLEYLRRVPYHADVSLPMASALPERLKEVEALLSIRRLAHPGGDVLYVDESDSLSLQYYSNNIRHLLILPSLIVSYLNYGQTTCQEELLSACQFLYPLLSREFFTPWTKHTCKDALSRALSFLSSEDQGLVVLAGGLLRAPDAVSSDYTCFRTLGQVNGGQVEKFSLYIILLARMCEKGSVSRDLYACECEQMLARMRILSGIPWLDTSHQREIRSFLSSLISAGYVMQAQEGLILAEGTQLALQKLMNFLSPGVREGIRQVSDGLASASEPSKQVRGSNGL